MKRDHGYVAKDFQLPKQAEKDILKNDLNGMVFNQIVENMTASLLQGILEEKNRKDGFAKYIRVYKTSMSDDIRGHIDYVVEIDGQCLWIDLATSDNPQYIQEKSALETTMVVEYQMHRQEDSVAKGKNRYHEVIMPRKVLAIEKEKMFAIVSEYMETITEVGGDVTSQDALDALEAAMRETRSHPEKAVKHFRNTILSLIAA